MSIDALLQLYSNYTAICHKCKSTSYNLQRSVSSDLISTCLDCPDFCSGCYNRTEAQINSINPFFDLKSPYFKYTYICYQEQSFSQQGYLSIIPYYLTAISCNEYPQCKKIINLLYYMYCRSSEMYDDYYEETQENLKKRYTTVYNVFIMEEILQFETPEIYEYLNRARISEANYKLELRGSKRTQSNCSIEPSLIKSISNYSQIIGSFFNFFSFYQKVTGFLTEASTKTHDLQLKVNVFTLRQVNLHIFTKDDIKVPMYFYTKTFISNFENIIIKSLQFLLPIPYRSLESVIVDNFYAEITFTNDYYPISLILENCEIIQNPLTKVARFSFISSKLYMLQYFCGMQLQQLST